MNESTSCDSAAVRTSAAVPAEPSAGAGTRRAIIASGLAVAAVSFFGYLLGWLIQSPVIDQACEYAYCEESARIRWHWQMQEWAVFGFVAGGVTAWWAATWSTASRHPALRKWGSVAAIVALSMVTIFFAVLTLAVATTTCDDTDFLCFGGPGPAMFFGSPGLLSGTLVAVLVAGLRLGATPRGRRLSNLGLTVVSTSAVLAGLTVFAVTVLDGLTS